MMHRPICNWLAGALLLIALAPAGVQQAGAQQPGGPSSATTSIRVSSTGAGTDTRQTLAPQDLVKLKLAPGFMVGLNVLDDPDFSGSFRIDEQGDISLPILGTIHIAGETVAEARTQIRNRLIEAQILKDPQVILAVLEYTAPEVTIIGEVLSPGRYSLLAPQKLIDVLAIAGGTTQFAGNEVVITESSSQAEQKIIHYSRTTDPKTVADVIVHLGDTVQVKRAGIVYVLGAVTRPGGYVMQEQGTLNVMQAISLASGTLPTAATKTIYLLRRDADGAVVYVALPYKKMTTGKTTDVELRAADMLFVPTSTLKSIFANTQGIITSAASASIYKY